MTDTIHTWQLQEAKNKLSEVIDEALHSGPQIITRHGRDTAVLISVDEFNKMRSKKKGFVQFFRDSPLVDSGINLDRSQDTGRKAIEL
jgi:prevent-host-death family protein